MTRRPTIFPQVAALASRRVALVSVAMGTAALLACSDRPTAPSSTAASSTALSPLSTSNDRFEHASATAHRLVTGLQRGRGSIVGPDGALYVTEAAAGR